MCYGNYSLMSMMNPMGMMNFGSINPFMGMMGGYGCGSIWSYGGGCCNTDYGAMAGWGVANTVVNLTGMAIVSGIQNHKSKDEQLTELNNEKNKLLQDAGVTENQVLDLDSYKNTCTEKIELETADNQVEMYKARVKDARSDVDAKQATFNSANAAFTLADKAIIEKYNGDPAKAKAQGEEALLQTAIEHKIAFEDAQKALEKAKNDLEKEQNNLTDAVIKQDEAFKAYQAKVKEMETLKSQIADINNKINAIKIEKADGCALNRTTNKQFNKIYDFEKGTFGKKNDGSEYTAADLTSADLRYLINKYKEGNANEKAQIRNFLASNINQIKDGANKGSIAEGLKIILK